MRIIKALLNKLDKIIINISKILIYLFFIEFPFWKGIAGKQPKVSVRPNTSNEEAGYNQKNKVDNFIGYILDTFFATYKTTQKLQCRKA